MNGWCEIKLKDLCERVTVGHVGPMADRYRPSGIAFLRSLNIKPFSLDLEDVKFIDDQFHDALKKSALRPGDVVLVRTGYPGTAAVIPESLPVSNCSDLVIVRPSKRLNPHFITAIFNSSFGRTLISGSTVGAAQQHFNITVAKELRFLMPPKPIQDKIGAILSTYDRLIENNRRRIALMESLAEEIYREWFVRLRFPGQHAVRRVKGLPKTWKVERVKAIIVRRKFGRIYRETELFSEGQVVVIDQSRADSLGFYDGEPQHVASSDAPIILFGDHTCKMVFMTTPFSLAENVIPFVPKAGISPYFLFHLLKDLAKTTEYKRHWIDLTTREVLVPEGILQTKLDNAVRPFHLQINMLRQAIRTAEKTRNLLVPRLISGELSVETLDIQVPPGMIEELG